VQTYPLGRPQYTEEWKWETAVWSQQGLVYAVGTFKKPVKMNFFQGAALEDTHALFNAGFVPPYLMMLDELSQSSIAW
jgi:hypothetical protein